MYRIVILIGITAFFFCNTVFAQNRYIDSLNQALTKTKDDSARIHLLGDLCIAYVISDTAMAKKFCGRVLSEASKTRSVSAKRYAFFAAGNYYSVTSDFAKAILYYKQALDLYRNRNEYGYAKTLYYYGRVFHLNGDFTTALTTFLKAESFLTADKDFITLVKLYSDIADVYMKMNRIDKFDEYFGKVQSIINNVDDTEAKSRAYIFTANVFVYRDNYDMAITYFNKAKEIAEPAGKFNVLTTWAYNYGFMYSRQDKYDEALVYYNKSMEYARLFNSRYDECDAMYKVGLMHYYSRRYNKADEVLKQALKLAGEIKSNVLIRNILDGLTYMEADRGNYTAAYNYLQQYVDKVYEIFSEDGQKQVNFLNAKYEAAKKEAEIRQLVNEKKIQAMEIQERKNLIYLLAGILILLTAVIFLVSKFYSSRKKINEQNILIQNQKIKELEKEKQLYAVQYALEGEEKERSRIARDLHDGLGCLLSGTKMSFSSLKDNYAVENENSDTYRHSMELLNKSITELRRIAQNMMPQALLNSGLKDAVGEFCHNINLSSAVSLKYQFYGSENKMQHKYVLACYRIIQELVNNIIKHSGASEAIVQLVQEEDRVSIVVQDNGKGFDTGMLNVYHGHGLNNIRMRVEALAGHYELSSSEGKGTEISIEFENIKEL